MSKENTETAFTYTPEMFISQPVALQEGQTQGNAGVTMGLPVATSERAGNCAGGGYGALGMEVGALVDEKQAAYGDSFGKSGDVLRILYPDGIPPEKIDDALCVTRIVDKLFRIATDRDALGESPYRDIAGYALLGAAGMERRPCE